MANTQLTAAALAKPDGLTMKQERFAQHYIAHGSVIEAYRHAYDVSPATNRNSLRATAFNVLNNPKVRARVAVLQAAAAEGAVTSTGDLIAALEEMVEADINEAMTLTVGCCRHCWGEGGAYQWKDSAEFARACDTALASGNPLPECGGYGFRNDREPNPDCAICHGVGAPRVRFTNTADVSRGVRRLFKGIELHADGSVKKLLFHDQTALRVELHKLRGMHIDRSVSLTARVNVPALKDLSPAEALDFLESLRPTSPALPALATLDAAP